MSRRAEAGAQSLTGRSALRVSAPARANLIGNPSDLYGGVILSCSVPLRASVALEPAEVMELRTRGEAFRIEGSADLALRGDAFDIARAVLQSLGETPPCRLEYETEIPLRSGLGGSSALMLSLLRALLAWVGEAIHPYDLVKRARAVEREILGVECGWVDFYMGVFGGLQYLDFRGLEREGPSRKAPSRRSSRCPGRSFPFCSPSPGFGTTPMPCTARSENVGSGASPRSCAPTSGSPRSDARGGRPSCAGTGRGSGRSCRRTTRSSGVWAGRARAPIA